jgi:hypothetical protein
MGIHIGWGYCGEEPPIIALGAMGCGYINVGAGEWLSIGEEYA